MIDTRIPRSNSVTQESLEINNPKTKGKIRVKNAEDSGVSRVGNMCCTMSSALLHCRSRLKRNEREGGRRKEERNEWKVKPSATKSHPRGRKGSSFL